ncbi:uncharacterized protein LOC113867764 [Abrus precatorius]|uniref:Uncharacterized protein LOC113867764 n=1 Tax=Abrus precatorius TaxID=3816 RepID=A0A8B8LU45_ABRPR|nr:uncharacterized protein LOC113867764 [Abrus precatorius]
MLPLPSISDSNGEHHFSSSRKQNGKKVDVSGQKSKRNNSGRIRVVGNRIYDSANGKTCHQCRQKTRDFAAMCKNLKNGKPCPIKLCHKCLLNRYGEKAEEVELLSDWTCPKCRGICNCSFCMKKRGQQPTGALIHTAKASGFKSVSEMLSIKGSEDLESDEVNNIVVSPSKGKKERKKRVGNSSSGKGLMSKVVSPMKQITSEKELVVLLSGEPGKENSLDGNSDLKLDSLKVQTSPEKSKEKKRKRLKEISNSNSVDTYNACENKNLKKLKVRNEVTVEKAKRSVNDGTKVSNEKETNDNHAILPIQMDGTVAGAENDFFLDINKMLGKNCKDTVTIDNGYNAPFKSQAANDFFNAISRRQTQIGKNHYALHGETNGPNAANDYSIGPVTLASNSNNFALKQQQNDGKQMSGINLNAPPVDDDDNAGVKSLTGIARFPQASLNSEIEKVEEEIPLPSGIELTEILDIEFLPKDVGNALQLLDFCRVFGKPLDLKKGEAEAIVRELVRKQSSRRGQNTLVVQFQIRLLTLILIDSGIKSPSLTATNGNKSWLKALKDLITESELVLKDFPLDWLEEGISGYCELDLSTKLRLLNFLCDEALSTEKLRSFIEDQNSRHAEEVKEAKSKVAAAKEKEKGIKQKLQNEVAKTIMSNVAPLSVEEHDALLSKIKSEAAQAHAEMLEAKGTIPKRRQCSDAMRTEPEFWDSNGQGFWKLKCYDDESAVLLQDIKIADKTGTATDEKWFVYGPEEKDEIDKYISSRAKRNKRRKVSNMLSNESSEANV